jgi:hypothetical protein
MQLRREVVIEAMSLSGSQPFAMLLCQFADFATDEPHPVAHYQSLIEQAGTGGLADYWAAAALNQINLAGSKVFGWKVLPATQGQYLAANPSRWQKIQGAIDAFRPEVNVNQYFGVIAVFNHDGLDTGAAFQGAGAGRGVVCGPGDTNVTFLGHETGHLFGLSHSYDTSSRKLIYWSAPGEYYDMHDIMSAANVYADTSSRFEKAGPLLAAPNLDHLGWLDPSRVWTPSHGSSFQDQVELVSLGHPEVSGTLAAKIEDLYVEFRTADGWDKAIPRPAVLIHSWQDPDAVVLASDPVNHVNDWQPGQVYGPTALHELFSRKGVKVGTTFVPIEAEFFLGGTWVAVESFNLQAKTARITITHQARPKILSGPRLFERVVPIVGGLAQEGPGWIVLPSGSMIPVPRGSPVLEVLDRLAIIATTEALPAEARRSVERTVVEELAILVERLGESDSTGNDRS